MRAAKRQVNGLNECKKKSEVQNRRRAGMANMPGDTYLTQVRSLKKEGLPPRFGCLIRRTRYNVSLSFSFLPQTNNHESGHILLASDHSCFLINVCVSQQ